LPHRAAGRPPFLSGAGSFAPMSPQLSTAALAALLVLTPLAAARGETGCRQDLADLERVSETVVLGDRTLRQIQGLLYDTEDLCEAGEEDQVALKLSQAWALLLADSRLIVPTAGALATLGCEDAAAEVGRRLEVNGAGAATRAVAEGVVAEARELCAGGDELGAQDKLAIVWTMLNRPQ
jgi:hypothetical protein